MPIQIDAVECPDPPPRPAWALELELPPTWAPGQRLVLELKPGWNRATGGECVSVAGRTKTGDEVSASASLLSSPECLAVPEPPPSALLGAGLVALVAWRRLRR